MRQSLAQELLRKLEMLSVCFSKQSRAGIQPASTNLQKKLRRNLQAVTTDNVPHVHRPPQSQKPSCDRALAAVPSHHACSRLLAQQHRHSHTATATLPRLHRHSSIATAASPRPCRHSSIATATPPRPGRHGRAATAASPRPRCQSGTATAAPRRPRRPLAPRTRCPCHAALASP